MFDDIFEVGPQASMQGQGAMKGHIHCRLENKMKGTREKQECVPED